MGQEIAIPPGGKVTTNGVDYVNRSDHAVSVEMLLGMRHIGGNCYVPAFRDVPAGFEISYVGPNRGDGRCDT